MNTRRFDEIQIPTYQKKLQELNTILQSLENSSEASVIDKALIGRMKASAKLLGEKKSYKRNGKCKPFQRTLPLPHLGRGCPDD